MIDPAYAEAHDLLDEEDFAETYEENSAWRAPSGSLIIQTLEVIEGSTCEVDTYAEGDWAHNGSGTEVNWDGQETVKRAGELVFLDEGGGEWLECQIIKDPTAPLPDLIVSPWDDRRMIEKLLRERFDDAAGIVMADCANGDTDPFQESTIDGLLAQLGVVLFEIRQQNK